MNGTNGKDLALWPRLAIAIGEPRPSHPFAQATSPKSSGQLRSNQAIKARSEGVVDGTRNKNQSGGNLRRDIGEFLPGARIDLVAIEHGVGFAGDGNELDRCRVARLVDGFHSKEAGRVSRIGATYKFLEVRQLIPIRITGRAVAAGGIPVIQAVGD